MWALVGSLLGGYVLALWRVRAASELVDAIAVLILGAAAFVALGYGGAHEQGHAMAVCVGGAGCGSLLARSWGLTLLRCILVAALGVLAGVGLMYLILGGGSDGGSGGDWGGSGGGFGGGGAGVGD